MEKWIDIFISPDLYEVSNLGNFRAKEKIDAMMRKRKVRNLILGTTKDGYKIVNLFINGKSFHKAAHRMVYESFNKCSIPDGMEVNHLNGDRADNKPENLEILSHADNVRYSKNVLKADYATYGNGRMTPEQREKILEMYKNKKTCLQISKEIGFSKSQVWNIVSHKCWKV